MAYTVSPEKMEFQIAFSPLHFRLHCLFIQHSPSPSRWPTPNIPLTTGRLVSHHPKSYALRCCPNIQHSIFNIQYSVLALIVTIQLKALVHYFPVVLFIMLYKVVLTFESVDEILSVTIQMKAVVRYFPVVLFIMQYKMVLSFESMDEILKCDHSNESF